MRFKFGQDITLRPLGRDERIELARNFGEALHNRSNPQENFSRRKESVSENFLSFGTRAKKNQTDLSAWNIPTETKNWRITGIVPALLLSVRNSSEKSITHESKRTAFIAEGRFKQIESD